MKQAVKYQSEDEVY